MAYRYLLALATGTAASWTGRSATAEWAESFIAVSSSVSTGLVEHARSIDPLTRDAATPRSTTEAIPEAGWIAQAGPEAY
jgi:hypothetical protein